MFKDFENAKKYLENNHIRMVDFKVVRLFRQMASYNGFGAAFFTIDDEKRYWFQRRQCGFQACNCRGYGSDPRFVHRFYGSFL